RPTSPDEATRPRRRAGTRRARARGPRASGPGERPGRNRRCATASPARPADEPPGRPPSHRQALATLGAAALERESAGAGLHAGSNAVGAGALALLRLVGAFHGSRAQNGFEASIRRGVSGRSGSHILKPPRFFPRFASEPR